MKIKITQSTPHAEELRASLQRAADRRERLRQEEADALEMERMFQSRKAMPVYVTVPPAKKEQHIQQNPKGGRADIAMLVCSVIALLASFIVYIGGQANTLATVLACISAGFGIAGGVIG